MTYKTIKIYPHIGFLAWHVKINYEIPACYLSVTILAEGLRTVLIILNVLIFYIKKIKLGIFYGFLKFLLNIRHFLCI